MKITIILSLVLLLLLASCSLDVIKRRLPPPTVGNGMVLFRMEAPSARTVSLAGDFPDNEWGGTASSTGQYDPNIDKLYDDGTHGDETANDGIWSLQRRIAPGRYQYKFVVDRNTWVTDPNAMETTDDGYGGKNSVLVVSQ